MDLIIPQTNFTPAISFRINESIFKIEGVSRPENVLEFYHKILEWLDKHKNEIKNEPKKLILEFKLYYFNTSSAKYLSQLLLKIKELKEKGKQVEINWHYQPEDGKNLEDGEDLAFSSDTIFNFIPSDFD